MEANFVGTSWSVLGGHRDDYARSVICWNFDITEDVLLLEVLVFAG